MMIAIDNQPHLTDLRRLIDQVPRYPLTAEQLVNLAMKKGAPKEVIDFYKAFPANEIFTDKEDLLARTEMVEILHHQDAPREILTSAEED